MRNSFLLPNTAVEKNKLYFLKEIPKNATFGQEFLGEEINGEFNPSYYCLELFAEKANSLIVNTKNAWQFTLGKALAFDSFISENVVNNSDMFVVKNGNNEIIGIAQKKPNSFYNVFDIGHYLRRELD